jgi:hypothetical protein
VLSPLLPIFYTNFQSRVVQLILAQRAAIGGNLAELDKEAGLICETLSDLLVSLLVDAGLV